MRGKEISICLIHDVAVILFIAEKLPYHITTHTAIAEHWWSNEIFLVVSFLSSSVLYIGSQLYSIKLSWQRCVFF